MRGRVVEIALGAAMCALLVVLLPAGFGPREAMHVDLRSVGPYQLGRGRAGQRGDATAHPDDLAPRLDLAGELPLDAPGLFFRRWQVDYGKRWLRRVELPLLQGPFDGALEGDFAGDSGAPSCGIALRIRPGVFAQSAAVGDVARDELNRSLPYTFRCGIATEVTLQRAESVDVAIVPRSGYISVALLAVLRDGTRIGARTRVRLYRDEGRLAVQRIAAVEPVFSGPVRDRCEGTVTIQVINFAQWLQGEDESFLISKARDEIAERVRPAIAEINGSLTKLNEPFALYADRPADRLSLSLPIEPVVTEDGLFMRVCPHIALGQPQIDPRVPLPRIQAGPPKFADVSGSEQARIDVLADAQALNQLLYTMWQVGELRRLGTSSLLTSALPRDIEALAFDVTGFDPQLPPLLNDADGPLDIALANVAIGTWGNRTVLGHAALRTRVATDEGRITLSGRIDNPRIQCVEQLAGGTKRWRLTPCLSELMPILADRVAGTTPRVDLDPSRLLSAIAGQSLGGLELEIGSLEARTAAPPVRLHASLPIRVRSAKKRSLSPQ